MFTPIGINSLRMAYVSFSCLTTGLLSVESPSISSEDTGKPVSFLRDPLVNFHAKNPRLLQKAKQKVKTVGELQHLLTQLLWLRRLPERHSVTHLQFSIPVFARISGLHSDISHVISHPDDVLILGSQRNSTVLVESSRAGSEPGCPSSTTLRLPI